MFSHQEFQELQVLLGLASIGVIMMNMIYLSLTLVLRLTANIRLSWASVIASLFMCWTIKLLILVPVLVMLPAETVENRWATGAFMMVMILVYILLILGFQPSSLKQLTLQSLKKTELEKNEYEIDMLKKAWKKASKEKNQAAIDDLDKKIAMAQDQRKEIKRIYSKFNSLRNLLSRKKSDELAEPTEQ